ncbi:MAG TPA: hypothetical protein VMD97_11005 [Candidatus Aquilonibacter sp.]|nr:hypothetical protein [Candidatus Aquilonibacter sp.]
MATPSDRRPLFSVILAFIIMAAVAVAVYLIIPHKLTAITVSKVDLFAPHTEFQASQGQSMTVVGEPGQSEDDLYVVAHLNITDKLHQPVIITGWTATVTFADGSTLDSTYIAKSELPRLEQIFPQIKDLATDPLGDGDEIYPGVADSGSVVLLFPNTTQDKWNHKGSAVLTITLRDHTSQTVKLP